MKNATNVGNIGARKKSGNMKGRYFKDRFDNTHKFFGLVHGRYDYYYGMYSIKHGTTSLLSCVGSLKTHGYELTDG